MQFNWRTLFLLCLLTRSLRAADPSAEIASFSEFKKIDVKALIGGQILAERGAVMDFPRGITFQTCYVADRPAKATAELLPFWDATPHVAKLGVYQNVWFTQVDGKTFDRLILDPGKRPMKRLIERTRGATPERADIQLNFNEFALLQSCLNAAGADAPKDKDQSVEAVQHFWARLLKSRWEQFQGGGFEALPTCDASRSKFSVNSEVQSLLACEQNIVKRFEGLLTETPFQSKSSPPPKPTTYYWALSEVNKTANPSLGAVYVKAFPDHSKMIDVTFYSSGDYFTSMVFYEFWPVTMENRDYTLIWRMDMVSAPSLAFTKGVDMMVAGGIMLQEVKKVVRAFQQDAAKQH